MTKWDGGIGGRGRRVQINCCLTLILLHRTYISSSDVIHQVVSKVWIKGIKQGDGDKGNMSGAQSNYLDIVTQTHQASLKFC